MAALTAAGKEKMVMHQQVKFDKTHFQNNFLLPRIPHMFQYFQ
jgi:hypothetical protein